jgi:hypothetical protein
LTRSARTFDTIQVVARTKLGPTAAAERMKRKKVDGHAASDSR